MNIRKIYIFLSLFILISFLWYILYNTIHKESADSINEEDKLLTFQISETSNSSKDPTISTLQQEDLIQFGKVNKFPNGIPKIIHYNYKSRMIPSQYFPLFEKCIEINPKIKFVFWTDTSSLNLIKTYYSNKFDVYKTYLLPDSEPLKKSDIIRYFILHRYGGIYMDFDTRCQRPIEEVMMKDSCILSREAEVQTQILWNYKFLAMNSFMACVPNHRFFEEVIKNIQNDVKQGAVIVTGPVFLTNIFEKYNATLNETDYIDPYRNVIVSSSEIFSPKIEWFLENRCRQPLKQWAVQGCKDLPEYRKIEHKLTKSAVVVHLFLHLGYKFAKGLIKDLLDVGTLNEVFIVS